MGCPSATRPGGRVATRPPAPQDPAEGGRTVNGLPRRVSRSIKNPDHGDDSAPVPPPLVTPQDEKAGHEQLLADLDAFAAGEQAAKDAAWPAGTDPDAPPAADETVAPTSAAEPIPVPEVEAPTIETAEVVTPEVETAGVAAPETAAPEVETPQVETTAIETPQVETPQVETPELKAPELETPDLETPESETTALDSTAIETPEVETAPERADEPVAERGFGSMAGVEPDSDFGAAPPYAPADDLGPAPGYAPDTMFDATFDAAADSTPTPPHGFPLPTDPDTAPAPERGHDQPGGPTT